VDDLRIERVVAGGGRGFTDYDRIEDDLRALLPLGLKRVAEGASNGGGADWLAHDAWWKVAARSTARYPVRADIDGRHRGAPRNRNVRMLDVELRLAQEAGETLLGLFYPDPKSSGTWHCVREAVKRGVTVVVWTTAARLADAGLPPLVMPDEPDRLEHFVFASDPRRVPDYLEVLGG
jgi:hypothetical protein